ncbi:unnamed protein product [Mytilus edulis]|uniref:Uncharacterized protein n=1 Tax=Mytilus edulis TaxID=6550 RepID=A0A8S3QYK7_MYTED|nr:unnamed protein product [Mytilus edulis]
MNLNIGSKVDMSEPLQFLLSIEIRNDNHDNGIDVESLIKRASSAIAEKAKYKFRVFGEAKIIASISHEDFDRLWSMNVRTMVNEGRQGLSQTEVFKILAEKRVYAFSCKLPTETWEAHIQSFKLDKIYKNAKLVTKL